MTKTRTTRTFAATLGLTMVGTVGTAAAQPVTTDPSVRPRTTTTPAPTPAPAQPTGVRVIQLGPDGRPVPDTAPADAGWYYDDSQPYDDEPQVIRFGPTPELHVVRSGDTLWDICWYYFNDPWQWPKVWSYNNQITNPHWIYPGDLVRLIPRGMFVQQTDPTVDNPPDSDLPPDTDLPPPTRRTGVSLRQLAFVEQSELDTAMKIDGSIDDKTLLSLYDGVYITYPKGKAPKVGQTYSIYTADNQVPDGAYVRILGQVVIRDVKQDKRARGTITEVNSEIERGALVGPLVRDFKTVPPVAPKVNAAGKIIAMLTRDQLVGEGELVFINLGEKSGLEVGNQMSVVRRGDGLTEAGGDKTGVGQNDEDFPNRSLGFVTIVEIGPKMSIGLVTLSVREMGVGDRVVMQVPTGGGDEPATGDE
jgi:hypothetical protein